MYSYKKSHIDGTPCLNLVQYEEDISTSKIIFRSHNAIESQNFLFFIFKNINFGERKSK